MSCDSAAAPERKRSRAGLSAFRANRRTGFAPIWIFDKGFPWRSHRPIVDIKEAIVFCGRRANEERIECRGIEASRIAQPRHSETLLNCCISKLMGAMSVSVSRPAAASCSRNMRAAPLRHVQKPASFPRKAWSGHRRAMRVRSSTETVESKAEADKVGFSLLGSP